MRLATFHVSAIECALPVERLREIVEPPPNTRVPGAAAAPRGVTNLRGQVIPVLDVAVRLGLAPSRGGRPCLLIAEAAAAVGACALVVDGIRGIEEVAEDRLLPPPPTTQAGAATAEPRPPRARPPAPRPPPLRPGEVYQVIEGDTRWSISRRMLGDPYAGPDIHAANRPAVPDPDLILPGQRLTVPPPPAEARGR